MIEVYTDGSSLGNPGTGGWAFTLVIKNKNVSKYGYVENATNNQMELTAAIKSLEYLYNTKDKLKIYTDSLYLKNGMTIWIKNWNKNNWKTANNKNVLNKDLWLKLYDLSKNKEIYWEWVKAHSKNFKNNEVDNLARTAAENKIFN